MAFPPLVLALAFVGVLGPGLLNCALALMLTGWPTYARLARAQTRILRQSDYLDAARMQGIVGVRLLWGHVLPACVPTVPDQVIRPSRPARLQVRAEAVSQSRRGSPGPVAEPVEASPRHPAVCASPGR